MKLFNSIAKLIPVLGLMLLFSSCSEDFNSIGSDIIGDPNFNFELIDNSTLKAYSRRTNPVQTNNLPVYRLGIFNDPVYGRSEANVLSQVTLETPNPSFGENPVIDSVVLHIPYFSTQTGANSYRLDSVYGNTPIKFSVIESNFFLRDFDPQSGFQEPQKYYSDQAPLFESFLGQTLYQNFGFIPSSAVVQEGTESPQQLSPRLRVHLPIEFFNNKILAQEGTDALLTNSNFRNHFRGVYFKVEASGTDGNMFIFNTNQARIKIHYSFDTPVIGVEEPGSGDEDGRSEATLNLLFNAITVNTISQNFPSDIQQVLSAQLSNAENLYLKGGPGAMTVIELFGEDLDGDGVPEELEDLRSQNLLVNEANLIFHVNQNIVQGGSKEPERIFIYDLNNNSLLLDYPLDPSVLPNNPVLSKTNHLGKLQRDAAGNGSTYRIRLTNHISNLINKDSTNVRLGLVVSQNVNVVDFQSLPTEIPPGIKNVPAGSVISHEGTVLHGPLSPDVDKRLKLNIYYTKIND